MKHVLIHALIIIEENNLLTETRACLSILIDYGLSQPGVGHTDTSSSSTDKDISTYAYSIVILHID